MRTMMNWLKLNSLQTGGYKAMLPCGVVWCAETVCYNNMRRICFKDFSVWDTNTPRKVNRDEEESQNIYSID